MLLIGTVDTKSDEISFLRDCLVDAGGRAVVMDVGVREHGHFTLDITNHQVAAAAGMTLQAVAASEDENAAMQAMTRGAVALTLSAFAEGRVHGVLVLGGTMGTDLALDVTAALPLGVPKFLVSTVSFSHLVPPERLAPDLMAILWAGGLYGLNSVCRSSLRMAANAVLGACQNAVPVALDRPLVGVTSLGTSALRYIVDLKPALEQRGYEVGGVPLHRHGRTRLRVARRAEQVRRRARPLPAGSRQRRSWLDRHRWQRPPARMPVVWASRRSSPPARST